MPKSQVLITGAGGEIGHGLINEFASKQDYDLIALDIAELDPQLKTKCQAVYKIDICDWQALQSITKNHKIDMVFHLAGLLSTGCEKSPVKAHEINVNGSFNLLRLVQEQSSKLGSAVKFLFASSIAAYGVRTLELKAEIGAVKEDQCLNPITIYGKNKLYVESLGAYFSDHFNLLSDDVANRCVDFKAVRFPGIISAETVPASGTSDYGPEMLHAAAQGRAYICFVRESSKIPFIVMPDAIKSLFNLSLVESKELSRRVYNIGSFAPSAGEIRQEILKYFPAADISFEAGNKRQAIVDSWPEDVDDSAARNDWGWQPDYNLERAFKEYLVPAVSQRYGTQRYVTQSDGGATELQKKCGNY